MFAVLTSLASIYLKFISYIAEAFLYVPSVVAALLLVEARSIRVKKNLMILPRKWKNLLQNQIFRRLLYLSQVCLICITLF
jgi:hypothetical protein